MGTSRREYRFRCSVELVTQVDLDLTGVLAAVVCPLAAAGVSFFGASTFDSDYVMVLQRDLRRALSVLRLAGQRVRA